MMPKERRVVAREQRAAALVALTAALKAALLIYEQETGEDTGVVSGAWLYAQTYTEEGPFWDSGALVP